MNAHDFTQVMIGGLIALNVWQLKLHMKTAQDISELKTRQSTIWAELFRRYRAR